MALAVEAAAGNMSVGALDTASMSVFGKPAISDKLYETAGEYAPITTILSKTNRRQGDVGYDMTFKHFVKRPPPSHVVVTVAVDEAATTLTFENTDLLVRHTRLMNRATKEILITRKLPGSATSCTDIVRGYGTVPAQAIEAGSVLMILGQLSGEGQQQKDGMNIIPDLITDYISTLEKAVEAYDHALLVKPYAGPNDIWASKVRDGAKQFMEEKERHTIWSQTKAGTYNSTTTGYLPTYGNLTAAKDWAGAGIIAQVDANGPDDAVEDVNGAITYDWFQDKLIDWRTRNGSSKSAFLFVPRGFLKFTAKLKDQKLLLRVEDSRFNFVIDEWMVAPGKSVYVIYDPQLNSPDIYGAGHKGETVIGLDLGDGSPEGSPYIHTVAPETFIPAIIPYNQMAKAGTYREISNVCVPNAEQQMVIEGITNWNI